MRSFSVDDIVTETLPIKELILSLIEPDSEIKQDLNEYYDQSETVPEFLNLLSKYYCDLFAELHEDLYFAFKLVNPYRGDNNLWVLHI